MKEQITFSWRQILYFFLCISYDLNNNDDKTLDMVLDIWKRSNSGGISYCVLFILFLFWVIEK